MRPKGAPQVQYEAELVRLEEDFKLVSTYGLTQGEYRRLRSDEESTKSEITNINGPICSDGRRVVQNQDW